MHQVDEVRLRTKAPRRDSARWAAPIGRARKARVSEALAKIAEGLVAAVCRARDSRRAIAFAPDTPWQAELEEAFPYEPTPDQAESDRRYQSRHGTRAPDGSARLRRRRLRQDRSRRARRVQGDRRQEASRGARADDAARRAALPHVQRALRVVSGAHRRALALQNQKRAAGDARRRSPRAKSTSSSARTGCCRKTSSSAISA